MKKAHLLASALIVIVGLAGLVVFAAGPGLMNNINFLRDSSRFEKTSGGEETEPKDVLTATEYNKLVNTVADLSDGGPTGGIPDCEAGQILQHDGTDWVCSGDTGSVPVLAPPGWPDLIVCTEGTRKDVARFGFVEPDRMFYFGSTENAYVRFNLDKTVHSGKYMDCITKGIDSGAWKKVYLSDANVQVSGGSDLPSCTEGQTLKMVDGSWQCADVIVDSTNSNCRAVGEYSAFNTVTASCNDGEVAVAGNGQCFGEDTSAPTITIAGNKVTANCSSSRGLAVTAGSSVTATCCTSSESTSSAFSACSMKDFSKSNTDNRTYPLLCEEGEMAVGFAGYCRRYGGPSGSTDLIDSIKKTPIENGRGWEAGCSTNQSYSYDIYMNLTCCKVGE